MRVDVWELNAILKHSVYVCCSKIQEHIHCHLFPHLYTVVPVPMLTNMHESIGLKAAPKAFQKFFGTLCRSIDPLALAVDLLSEEIVEDEAVQKMLAPMFLSLRKRQP